MTAAGASEHLYLPHDDDNDDGSVGAADDSHVRFRVVVRRDDVGVFNTHRMKTQRKCRRQFFCKIPIYVYVFLSFFLLKQKKRLGQRRRERADNVTE